ncbi:Alanine dehydrogenase/PNT, N-terminal domain [Collimonas sp. OK242]|nr:Alanine dehydrogenase/PNT, N-terminal domain [Collimonas sp. OK242]
MLIGITLETRPGEIRVAATPEMVKKLVAAKHQVLVQSGAGILSSITDEAYATARTYLAVARIPKISPVIYRTFPLEQAAQAHALMGISGKSCLRFRHAVRN